MVGWLRFVKGGGGGGGGRDYRAGGSVSAD